MFSTPATQAVVVFPGTKKNPYGHVARVDAMYPYNGGIRFHVWEMNVKGLNIIDDHWYQFVSGESFIPAPAI